MGRLTWLSILGGAVFAGTLVATAPLSIVADRDRLGSRGITFDRAQGTVWSGDLLGVEIGGQPVGRVTLDLKPLGLLAGQMDYAFDVAGPAGRGRGGLALNMTGDLRFRDVVADVNLQAIERLDSRLRQVPATVAVTLPDLVAGRDLSCRQADGRLRTDLLERLGGRLSWQGPAMAGVIACDGQGGYQVNLANVDGPDTITVDAKASPQNASYTLDARVETDNRSVSDTLVLMQFQREDDAFIYSRANGVVRSMGEAG